MKRWAVRGSVGDELCFISAAHAYARIHGEQVTIESFRDVIECYDDGLLTAACKEDDIPEIILDNVHLDKAKYGESNYLGMMHDVLMPGCDLQPAGELPEFDLGVARCVIQPFSDCAENPPLWYLESVVRAFTELTGKTLYAVGIDSTPHVLQGVDYSLLEDSVPALMGHVQNARVVLTPRSASAHIAALYGVPAYVWLPSDGLDWHLGYNGWDSKLSHFDKGFDNQGFAEFLGKHGLLK